MTLRRKMLVARALVWAACAVGIVVTAEHASLGAAWVVAFVLLGGAVPTQNAAYRWLARRAFARFHALKDAGRYDEARAAIAELRRHYSVGSAVELTRYYEATVYQRETRHAEAIRLLESIDRRVIQKNMLPWLLHGLAWSHLRTGNGALAAACARESMDASAASDRVASPDQLRAVQLGALGAAHVLLEQPAEALPLLEQCLARVTVPAHKATAAFYLGDALHALGRHTEARERWKEAVEAAPEWECARDAKARLERDAPPYRS